MNSCSAHRTPICRERGQAIVLVLLLSAVGVLVALSLVDTGILVSEKMQLQNAADATAFSVSTLEARDLNFSAYTNRAMVANEVGIGQLVGMVSWSVMLDSVPGYASTYVNSVPVVGQFLSPFFNAAKGLTGFIHKGVKAFATSAAANPFGNIPWLRQLNDFYSSMQTVMHIATLSVSAATLFDMIGENAKDARLSLFGYLALARHFTSYYSELTGGILPSYVVTQSQDSASPAQKAGMRRLASVVNASRDPFTKNRANGWEFGFGLPRIKFNIELLGVCVVCVDIQIGFWVKRRGGSDMRFVERNQREQYGWSAVDTLGAIVDLHWKVTLLDESIPKPPLPLGLPLGIGGAMVGKLYKPRELLPKKNPILGDLPNGDLPNYAYGYNPEDNAPIWWLGPIPNPAPSLAVNGNNLDGEYPGLPDYQDSRTHPWPIAIDKDPIDKDVKVGWEAPYLLIALYKPSGKIPRSQAVGRFDLDPGTAHDELDVLGKSEVYFSRPTDLAYFARADGHIELANTFNPYWDARLVDTSYIDRVAALQLSQQQPWAWQNVASSLGEFQKLLSFVPGLRGL